MLEFSNVQVSQSGEVGCTARNNVGSKRQNAQLEVRETGNAPTFVRKIEAIPLKRNDTLRMGFILLFFFQIRTVLWRKIRHW